jgi:hypothetical protein
MEAARLSETSATTSQSAWHHVPEECNFHRHCSETFKFSVSTKNTHVINGNILQKSNCTNTLYMKCKKKSSAGKGWVFLNKGGTSIGITNFWAKLEKNSSLRLGVDWDRTVKISYNHKKLEAPLLILVAIPMKLLRTCELCFVLYC